jgi:nucleotide-binding universal stress UspA family protein
MQHSNETSARFPEHILCGIDLQGRANHAVAAALWLSERLGKPMELVHAFPARPIFWGKEEDQPEWVAGTEAVGGVLREMLRTIVAEAPRELELRTSPDALRFHVTAGNPVHVILERARASSADLIVLGPHRKHRGLDFGDTARGVLAHAPRGVWMQPEAPRAVRRILVPVDLSAGSLAALAIARDLAQTFDARVTAIHVFEYPEYGLSESVIDVIHPSHVAEQLQRAERERYEAAIESFDWRGVAHDMRFERGQAAQTVLAIQDDFDLVVMGTHGRTGLSAALLGAVAHTVLRSARIPVLALRYAGASYLV